MLCEWIQKYSIDGSQFFRAKRNESWPCDFRKSFAIPLRWLQPQNEQLLEELVAAGVLSAVCYNTPRKLCAASRQDIFDFILNPETSVDWALMLAYKVHEFEQEFAEPLDTNEVLCEILRLSLARPNISVEWLDSLPSICGALLSHGYYLDWPEVFNAALRTENKGICSMGSRERCYGTDDQGGGIADRFFSRIRV